MTVLIMVVLTSGLGAQLRGLLVGGGGLPLEAPLLGGGLLLGGVRVGRDGFGFAQTRLGELIGPLLGRLATRRLLQVRLPGGVRVLTVALTLHARPLALGLGP